MDWNLPLSAIESLTLAADVRFGGCSYLDDHIWELSTRKGELPALSLQTTFGLRAHRMRIFPRWVEAESPVENPDDYAIPPVIREAYANMAVLTCSPLEGLNAELVYRVPHARGVGGYMRVSNEGKKNRTLRLEWAALLTPIGEESHRMLVRQHDNGVWYLHGKSNGLHCVLLMRGDVHPSPGPHPALALTYTIAPNRSVETVWAHAAASTFEEAFTAANQILQRNHAAERTRITLLNSGNLRIHTGEPAWDTLFALGQQRAFTLLTAPPPHLEHPVPVFSRTPDDGYSQRGDGADYPLAWLAGHTLWNSVYLAAYLLPGYPELAAGLLENFLQAQDPESGHIPHNPNHPEGRSTLLAIPLLAGLAWQIYLRQREQAFLARVFEPLYRFLQAWLARDADGDGLPEWQSLRQLHFFDHPLFSPLHPWAQGADIRLTETPALQALLYREGVCLMRMAQVLGREGAIPALQAICDNLKSGVEAAWDDGTYYPWDRDTHHITTGQDLGAYPKDGEFPIKQEFDTPMRPLASVLYEGGTPPQVHLTIQGVAADGSPLTEQFTPADWRWAPGRGYGTASQVFRQIEHIHIQGLPQGARVVLRTLHTRRGSIDSLLPLTGGIPKDEQARMLIEETLLNPEKYWQANGIPFAPLDESPEQPLQMVSLLWNTWLGYGLLRYGYRQQSAELLTRLMNTLASDLENEGALHAIHHCHTGEGTQEHNTLDSLPPIGLFMESLGVRIYSQWRVRLEGHNPFPWPVEIRFRGLHIRRGAARTEITFPDGQTAVVESPVPCVVHAEEAHQQPNTIPAP
ncbi:MAG: hypothetical protein D6755_11425 [Anaerolineae bacterium]|nr:MAG: hypothetical protein D6755_11425 [Anaerolineae bacterium]